MQSDLWPAVAPRASIRAVRDRNGVLLSLTSVACQFRPSDEEPSPWAVLVLKPFCFNLIHTLQREGSSSTLVG